MEITNNENYFTNSQLSKVLALAGYNYIPSKLIICEDKRDVLKLYRHISLISYIRGLMDIPIWIGKVEGVYYPQQDVVIVYIFSQTDDGKDKQSKQLYSLHALSHEVRHRWQYKNKFKKDEEKDADKFATKFVNTNSKKISKIMEWEDEWEVEEE